MASHIRRVCRLRTRCVCWVSRIYMVSRLCPSRQQTCGLRASDVSNGGMAASVGRDRRVCCLRHENTEFQQSRHMARRGGVRHQGEHLSGRRRRVCRPGFYCVEKPTASFEDGGYKYLLTGPWGALLTFLTLLCILWAKASPSHSSLLLDCKSKVRLSDPKVHCIAWGHLVTLVGGLAGGFLVTLGEYRS
jgi:hypothetical protein